MFGKFLNSPECMKVLSWLLDHSDGEYSAAILAVECDMGEINEFMAVLSTLEAAGFIQINDSSDELMIKLDKNTSITQLLIHLKDEFNDIGFRSNQISPALSYLHSPQVRDLVDTEILKNVAGNDILDMLKNYKELNTSDPKQKEIYELCVELEKKNLYENFIKDLEKNLE